MGGVLRNIAGDSPRFAVERHIGPIYGDAGCGIRDRHRTGLTNMPVV